MSFLSCSTVALDGARITGILSAKIIGTDDGIVSKKGIDFKKVLEIKVMKMTNEMNK